MHTCFPLVTQPFSGAHLRIQPSLPFCPSATSVGAVQDLAVAHLGSPVLVTWNRGFSPVENRGWQFNLGGEGFAEDTIHTHPSYVNIKPILSAGPAWCSAAGRPGDAWEIRINWPGTVYLSPLL